MKLVLEFTSIPPARSTSLFINSIVVVLCWFGSSSSLLVCVAATTILEDEASSHCFSMLFGLNAMCGTLKVVFHYYYYCYYYLVCDIPCCSFL